MHTGRFAAEAISKRLVKKIDYSGNLVMNHKYYLDWREDNYCAALFFINR